MPLIVFHPLRPRNPRSYSWGGGEGAILIPGQMVHLWDKFSKELIYTYLQGMIKTSC